VSRVDTQNAQNAIFASTRPGKRETRSYQTFISSHRKLWPTISCCRSEESDN